MVFPEIVSKLDALIARWTLAREILVSTLPRSGSANLDDLLITSEPANSQATVAESASSPRPEKTIAVTIVQPRRPRERRSAARPSAPQRTALNGAVPTGPVVVAPRRVAEADAGVRPLAAARGGGGSSSPLDELIAEISRRSADQGLSINS